MASLAKDGNWPKWSAFIAPLGVLFSFVFWKLDDRTRDLVRVAEDALKELDARWNLSRHSDGGPNPLALFEREEFVTSQRPANTPLATLKLSYRRSFNLVFLSFGIAHFFLFFAMLITGR
jgi:hypothetical protein